MYYLGVDIGGSSIKAGLVDESGGVHQIHRTPTIIDDREGFLSSLVGLVSGFEGNAIRAVGVGVPGFCNHASGLLEMSPNIPCLQAINLEEILSARLGKPVVVENDAKAGAYGESVRGAARGFQHVAYITIGTGLGCGLVLHGKVYRGASGYAGELGHTTIEPDGRPCLCGSRGCLETIVSATGMVETARELMQTHPESSLHGSSNALTAQFVYDAAVRGDAAANQVFQITGRYLGIACANLINLLNLEMIVIGGGVIASGQLLIGTAIGEVQRRAFGPAARICPIVQSQLWPDGGLIGAAMLARNNV